MVTSVSSPFSLNLSFSLPTISESGVSMVDVREFKKQTNKQTQMTYLVKSLRSSMYTPIYEREAEAYIHTYIHTKYGMCAIPSFPSTSPVKARFTR